MTHALLLTSALWASAPAAAAERCAAIEADRDTLTEGERKSALLLLEDALAGAGEPTKAPCGGQWTVSHVKLGASVTVSLSRGDDKQTLKVAALDELPAAYERLVRAIKTGQPVSGTADRSSVTSAEANPNRAEADPLVYLQIGGGATGLDPVLTASVNEMIVEAQESFGVTSVVVSHDMASTFRISHSVAMLYQGELLLQGSPADFMQSQDERIRAFVFAGSAEEA